MATILINGRKIDTRRVGQKMIRLVDGRLVLSVFDLRARRWHDRPVFSIRVGNAK